MASDDKTRKDPDSTFSYGVRELREAKATQKLTLDIALLKTVNEKRGFDPYNSTGSFDRKKHWARVGRR